MTEFFRRQRSGRAPGRVRFRRFVLVVFASNWVWEAVHGTAYVGASKIWWERAWHCVPSALGDLALSIAVVLGASVIARGVFGRMGLLSVAWTSAALGAVTAAVVERLALASGRWQYTEAMPLVPWTDLGVWPVLQMMVLPPLAFAIAWRSNHRAP